MKVRELIEILSKYDENLSVGVKGHFGEFFDIDKLDIDVSKTYYDSTSLRYTGFKSNDEFKAVIIHPPYIGEEPN